MSQMLVVIENAKDWKPYYPSEQVITAEEYLLLEEEKTKSNVMVLNLCRSYKYLSLGWYVSLLAESRKDKIFPRIKALQDLTRKSIYSLDLEDFDALVAKAVKSLDTHSNQTTSHFTFKVFFGEASLPLFEKLGRQLFDIFNLPILKVDLKHKGNWIVDKVTPGTLHHLSEVEEDLFAAALEKFSNKIWRPKKPKKSAKYDIAILHDPLEKHCPSNPRALQKFIKIGKELDINVELVEKKHYAKIAEYDALFIRQTTGVTDHTYRFAKKADSEGMVVIDDPTSILRCTNKIYLANLLKKNKVPHPKTIVLTEDSLLKSKSSLDELGFPFILKIPDGSFSRGMAKIKDPADFETKIKGFFDQSDLVLAQEYMYTDFDWRIGILNNEIIYACKYFMSKGHWQVINHKKDGKYDEGLFTAHTPGEVPVKVAKVALKAAACIGNGLYGVDLKETDRGPMIVEVNDNPNIDAGIEDKVAGDELYRKIWREFIRRIEE